MTCVVAVVHDGKVYMGADSAGSNAWSIATRDDPKVFVVGPMVIGYTTSFRMGQILRFRLTPPPHHREIDDDQYMMTDFVDAVRSVLKAGGWAGKENEVERGGNFLVGYKGRIWEVESDYQVALVAHPFNAVGSGYHVALGSLHTSKPDPSDGPEDVQVRLTWALEAAAEFAAGVRGPFVFAREP